MITSELFHRIKYHSMRINTKGRDIAFLQGFDSEATTTGRPFLFGFGDGRHCVPNNLLRTLEDHYLNTDFAVWNLKYDAGAIIYDMPKGGKYVKALKVRYKDLTALEIKTYIPNKNKTYYRDETGDLFDWDYTAYNFVPGKIELWTKNTTHWTYLNSKNECVTLTVQYVPHKLLKLTWSKDEVIRFWDICQFFESSLDKAAITYLGEGKDAISTKKFTRSFIKHNFDLIKKYCIHDAVLTRKLGNYFLEKLSTFGIRATSLYSSASLSFRYFQDHGDIIDIDRYWKNHRETVKMAIDSYEGGKFEITARGAFPMAHEYDIVSAYPYELANLVDIRFAKVKINAKYEPSAVYGFLRCHISVYEDVALPCGLIINNTRVYAIGSYYITITKNEYEYLLSLNVKVTIITASWLFVENTDYPYRNTVNTLFSLKHEYKKKDPAIYQVIKICLNGFYGKMAQCIKDYKDNYNAGVAFNPFYASVITANCRIRVAQMQNRFKKKCLAVHTDSIILTSPLPESELSPVLGSWEHVVSSSGLLIACGCYQIGSVGGYKGFEPHYKTDPKTGEKIYETWNDILSKYPRRKFLPSKTLQVESWVSAVARGHFGTINKFEDVIKKIDLNADIKRVWSKDDMKAGDYLNKLYHSRPRVITQTDPPKYWGAV